MLIGTTVNALAVVAGALAGMYCFRHKTRYVKFSLGIPLILAVQIALAVFLR